MAVERPMPDDAPVMTMVLPSRRLDIAEEAMLRILLWRRMKGWDGRENKLSVRRIWVLSLRGRIRGFY